MTVIRRSDGREWRIEPSDGGIPLVFGDGKYDHDPPRVASGLESALADQLAGAVDLLRGVLSGRVIRDETEGGEPILLDLATDPATVVRIDRFGGQ